MQCCTAIALIAATNLHTYEAITTHWTSHDNTSLLHSHLAPCNYQGQYITLLIKIYTRCVRDDIFRRAFPMKATSFVIISRYITMPHSIQHPPQDPSVSITTPTRERNPPTRRQIRARRVLLIRKQAASLPPLALEAESLFPNCSLTSASLTHVRVRAAMKNGLSRWILAASSSNSLLEQEIGS